MVVFVCGFDNAIIYAFEKDGAPRFLSKVEKRNSDSVNRIYQRGAYLMDPFYQELQKGGSSKVLTLKDVALKVFIILIIILIFIVRRVGVMRRVYCWNYPLISN